MRNDRRNLIKISYQVDWTFQDKCKIIYSIHYTQRQQKLGTKLNSIFNYNLAFCPSDGSYANKLRMDLTKNMSVNPSENQVKVEELSSWSSIEKDSKCYTGKNRPQQIKECQARKKTANNRKPFEIEKYQKF